MNNINIVILYKSHEAITKELTAYGMIKDSPSEDGTPPPELTAWPFLRTSDDTDAVSGEILCGVKDIQAELVDKLLALNPTSFTVEWRSDETDKDGNQLPRPTFTVNVTDLDGKVTGTRQRECGGFA